MIGIKLLIILYVLVRGQLIEQLLDDIKYPQAKLYADSKSHHVDNIAVFLLASLKNSIALGEPAPKSGEFYDYFQRLSAAKQTWASKATHFYGVTGSGESETRIFNRHQCRNLSHPSTHHPHHAYRSYSNHPHVLYECAGTKILHVPACDGSSWGADGPCCRCSGAMKFFLDLLTLPRPPQWFIFADDDYFMRLHYLDSLFSSYPAPTTTPYAAILWGSGDHDFQPASPSNSIKQGRSGYGLGQCKVPCVHRLGWMGFGGFSSAAMEQMAVQIQNDTLINVCRSWGVTHDIGLAIFTWMQSLPLIRVVEHIEVMNRIHALSARGRNMGSSIDDKFEPAIFHNHFKVSNSSLSEIFSRTVEKGMGGLGMEGMAVGGSGGSGKVIESTFDVDRYVAREQQLGRNMGSVLLPLKNNGGYLNSWHHRVHQVLSTVASGITFNATMLSKGSSLRGVGAVNLPSSLIEMRSTDYLPSDCEADAKLFAQFLSESGIKYTKDDEPRVCVRYGGYVANKKVEVGDFGLGDEVL